MPFRPDNVKRKPRSIYKSIYIPEQLAQQVDQLAADNDASFSSMVVRMIEYCLKEMEQEPEEQ